MWLPEGKVKVWVSACSPEATAATPWSWTCDFPNYGK